jgi:hypothetical protein
MGTIANFRGGDGTGNVARAVKLQVLSHQLACGRKLINPKI